MQSAKASLDNLISPRVEEQTKAAAALEQARLSLEQAKRNLENAKIIAPFDGTITAVTRLGWFERFQFNDYDCGHQQTARRRVGG